VPVSPEPRRKATALAPQPSLRERAEGRLPPAPLPGGVPLAGDTLATLHELRVHQIELEIQNEELRRAQWELAQSRDRYADLFEFAPAGYLSLDPVGTILEANLTAAAFLGRERSKLLGKPFARFVAAASQDTLHLHRLRVRASSLRQVAEVQVRPSAHAVRWIELQSTWREAETGRAPEWRIALVDVTGRKEADRLIILNQDLERRIAQRTIDAHTSGRHLAGILSSTMDAIISTDEAQRIVLFNRAAEKMFGLTADQIVGLPLGRLIPEGGQIAHRRKFREFAESAETSRRMGRPGRVYGRRADGSSFPVEVSISKVDVGDERVFTAILRDVSERVQAEEELRRSEEVMADFFLTAPLGLLWVGPDGRVERANRVELQLLDRAGEAVVGQHVAELHADAMSVATLLDQLSRRQPVENFRLAVRTKEGILRQLLIDANGLWEKGRLVHSRWCVRDISQRLELEREILAIAEQERARIGQDLHDDLCQQLVAIEYANETLAAQWGEQAPAAAEKAHVLSGQLRKVTEQARELARGLTPNLQIGADGLTAVLEELAENTRRVFDRDCCVKCPVPIRLRDLSIAVHLYRIAQEAVANAIRHGKAKQIVIRLAAQDRDLFLGVEDNGIGLPAKPTKGLGAGLRIMRYRLGMIGGSLELQRMPHGGTAIVCAVRDAVLADTTLPHEPLPTLASAPALRP
jgi:PAS domain S-box-containing protein